MNKRGREALEAAGPRIGEAKDFHELSDEGRRLGERRVAVSRAVRARREQQGQVTRNLETASRGSP